MSSRWTLGLLVAVAACSEDAIVTIPPTGTPTQLAVAVQPSAAGQSGVALAQFPVVRLKDAGGAASNTAGVVVTVSGPAGLTFGGLTTATTDGSGTARFSGLILYGLVGNYALHFTSGSLTAADAQPVALAAGPLARVKITTQPSGTAVAGITLAQQPVVQLRDVQGNPVARSGVAVTAVAVLGAGASVTNATATTNAAGQATFAGLALGGAAGPHLLIVTAAGAFLGDTSTAITLSAGPATQLALTTQPATTSQSGLALPTQPVASLRDAFGNAVSQAGVKVAVTLLTAPGAATVSNDTAITDATGTATFSGFRIKGLVGSYTLRFTATGYTSAVAAAALTLTPGAPAFVKLTTGPSPLPVNAVPFGTQPIAVVTDSATNRVSQAGISIDVSVAGVTPGGNSVLTDATGKATFSTLRLTGLAPNTYKLFFGSVSNPALLKDSAQVQLQPGAPHHLVIATSPSTGATNAVALAQVPQVQLRDTSDNNVPQSGVVVTATLTGANSGNAVISNGSANTNASGVATFSNGVNVITLTGLAALGSGTNYTLRFSAPSLGFVDSPTFTNLVPGAATKLALTTQPSTSATSGVQLAQQPVVQLQDVSGNATATPANVQITTGVLSGSVTISGGTVFTAAGTGAATFTNLTLTASPGSYTLIFSVLSGATGVTAIQAAQPTVVN